MYVYFSSTVCTILHRVSFSFNILCLTHLSLQVDMFKGQVCLSACFSLLGKIEVKILTRKNADEAGDQWLTEEDTKSFRELLISLLVTGEVFFIYSYSRHS